jgi:hypothetical protein
MKQETPKKSAKNNIIEDWLKEHGDPEVDKEVECKLEQITLEEAFKKWSGRTQVGYDQIDVLNFGAKWQAERMYNAEEVIAIVEKSRETGLTAEYLLLTKQFKKK